jgi:hypothetical protein
MFLNDIFKSVAKVGGGIIKAGAGAVKGVANFGVGTAQKVMQLPGKALAGNLKSLGLSANTLLYIGAGLVVLMMVTTPGGAAGVGGRFRR